MFLSSQSLQFLLETCKILVIGAGGLGCELLKDLVGYNFDLCNINVFKLHLSISSHIVLLCFRPCLDFALFMWLTWTQLICQT